VLATSRRGHKRKRQIISYPIVSTFIIGLLGGNEQSEVITTEAFPIPGVSPYFQVAHAVRDSGKDRDDFYASSVFLGNRTDDDRFTISYVRFIGNVRSMGRV
jgi:hypothetical protein